MSRNRYDDAFGVVRLRWRTGAPSDSDSRPVLCEVWRPSMSITWTPLKPEMKVTATLEMRVVVNEKWHRLGYNGSLRECTDGTVRRHAYLGSRHWIKTIALDGWDKE